MKLSIMYLWVGFCVVTAAAAPLHEADVAADAQWIVHGDASAFRQTEVGRYLLAELSQPANEALFAAFKSVWNSDPRTDLDSYTLYGRSAVEKDAVVIFKGRYDLPRSVAILKTNASYQASQYGGLTVHHWIEGSGKPLYLCASDTATIVITHEAERMNEALDVLQGRAPSAKPGDGVAVGKASFAAFANLKSIAGAKPQSILLQQAESVSLAYLEDKGQVTLTTILRTADSTAAEKLSVVVRGMLATMELNAGANPDAQARAGMLRMIQGIHLRQQSNQLTVTLQVSAGDFIESLKTHAYAPLQGSR